ncbi:MAG: helix-turn-helix domain-containing protein [Thermotaleaceae bacterium]
MKDILVLRELDQIKAISHPYRIEIIECFDEDQAATAKQIADKLGEPHAKINYHIKTLQKVGILELVDERVKSGIIEKYYLPAAKTFVIDKSIMNSGDKKVIESLNQASMSIFENISNDFYKALENANEKEHPKQMLHFNDYYFTVEETEELKELINNTIEDFVKDKKDKSREGTKGYSISALIIPRIKKKK